MHDMYTIGHTSQLGTKGTIARNAQGTMCTIGTIDGTLRVTSGTLGMRMIGTKSALQVKIFRGKCK